MSREQQTTPGAAAGSGTKSRLRQALVRRETLPLLGCFALLLLAAVPPLINLGRFGHRIAGAISRSIGRPVSMDSIHLRLLPWPAFAISNLSVGEAPGFGAEPALRAPDVVVEPRLSSLWRGRFELSRVELTDASVNLVRNGEGRWNVSSVLLQASQIPNAPTAQAHPGPAPRFPYIEATNTRVNIKRGNEKLPYSLLNAEFSMFLVRPEVWQLSLEGQPVRTDLELSLGDTGLLRIHGELHRASAFGTMPLAMDAEWSHAPLGQLSRLLLGRDTGWRGDIDASASLRGEIDDLAFGTHTLITDLHRQEFSPQQPFTVDASCSGHSARAHPEGDSFGCRWPVGTGALLLTHTQAVEGGSRYVLTANSLPPSTLLAGLGLMLPGLTDNQDIDQDAVQNAAQGAGAGVGASVDGSISGSLAYAPSSHTLSGALSLPLLQLGGAGASGEPLLLRNLLLRPAAGGMEGPPTLLLTADPIDLGSPGTRRLALSAQLTEAGYAVHAAGSMSLAALQQLSFHGKLPFLAHLAPATSLPQAASTAELALTGSAAWLDRALGSSAQITGHLHMENARWSPSWLPVPVDLRQVDAVFTPGSIAWTVPDAVAAHPEAPPTEESGAAAVSRDPGPRADSPPIHMSGEAEMTVGCMLDGGCPVHFSLQAGALSAVALQTLLTRQPQAGLAYLLGRSQPASASLPALEGTVHADLLLLGRLPIHDATLALATGGEGKTMQVQALDGRTLGGNLHLHGDVRFTDAKPVYTLLASVTGASVAQTAALWHESWGDGAGMWNGEAQLQLRGTSTAELLDSALGSFHLVWLHGSLGEALPHFASWDASGQLQSSGLLITKGVVSGPPATLGGTAGWDRRLHLALTPGFKLPPGAAPAPAPVQITGTLAAPELPPATTTETTPGSN